MEELTEEVIDSLGSFSVLSGILDEEYMSITEGYITSLSIDNEELEEE